MHPLNELLLNSGLIRDGQVQTARLAALSFADIERLAEQSCELTVATERDVEPGIFSHSASISLGGGRFPCSALDCRTHRVAELAQFAVLYSDRVFVRNFLADHVVHIEKDSPEFRRRFADDVALLAELAPLLDAGVVVPVVPARNLCLHCLATASFGPDADRRLDVEARRLRARHLGESELTIAKAGERYLLSATGPADLYEHEQVMIAHKLPKALRDKPRIRRQIASGMVVRLGKELRRSVGFHDHLAGFAFHSIAFELAISSCIGASFLTESPLVVGILGSLADNVDLVERNQIIEQNLSSMTPFVADVPLESLLELRKREGEAFLVYRRAINAAVDEIRTRRTRFTAAEAKELYSDVIEPELGRLDQRVKAAARDLRTDAIASVGGWVGALSFGLYSGLVPNGLHAAAAALGLTKVVEHVGKSILAGRDQDAAVRGEDLYFLWKARSLSRRVSGHR